MDWSELSYDERLVLPNVSDLWPDHYDSILKRVRGNPPRSFGERRLRDTLRSLEDKNLVVRRRRSLFVLHIDGRRIMDHADVRTGLRRRVA